MFVCYTNPIATACNLDNAWKIKTTEQQTRETPISILPLRDNRSTKQMRYHHSPCPVSDMQAIPQYMEQRERQAANTIPNTILYSLQQ